MWLSHDGGGGGGGKGYYNIHMYLIIRYKYVHFISLSVIYYSLSNIE